jgi:hypothetical protein
MSKHNRERRKRHKRPAGFVATTAEAIQQHGETGVAAMTKVAVPKRAWDETVNWGNRGKVWDIHERISCWVLQGFLTAESPVYFVFEGDLNESGYSVGAYLVKLRELIAEGHGHWFLLFMDGTRRLQVTCGGCKDGEVFLGVQFEGDDEED